MAPSPEYIEPVKLVKYEKVIGDVSDTSCELVPPPLPPPRDERISFLAKDEENNSSENESMFNISVNHSILSEKIGASSSFKSKNVRILKKREDSEEDNQSSEELRENDSKIEPLITLNISVKNERNGVLIHRKIYL